jgi:MoaA/NifB/PqqE/SkfB family radical SAM enzyme
MSKQIKRDYYPSPVGKSPFIYAGYVCNNNCIFCFEKDLIFTDKGTENLKKEIKAVRKKFDFINFMGKEPTLREDIFELVKYAKELEFQQIGITTNGRMFSYIDFTKKIFQNGLNQAVVTVTGHTEEMHEWHTLTKNSFRQTLAGIKNIIFLKDHNISLVLNVMVTQKNYKLLPDIISYYIDLGLKEINIGHILPFNKNIKKSKTIVARMIDVIPYLIEVQNRYGKEVKFLFVEYPPCVFPKEYRCLSFPCLEESPQKIYFDLCKKCNFKKQCTGIHKYYIDLYGDKEFKF